jgi:hypothetical protein
MEMLASNHQAIVARENNPKRKAFHKLASTSEEFCSTPLSTMPKQLLWLVGNLPIATGKLNRAIRSLLL